VAIESFDTSHLPQMQPGVGFRRFLDYQLKNV